MLPTLKIFSITMVKIPNIRYKLCDSWQHCYRYLLRSCEQQTPSWGIVMKTVLLSDSSLCCRVHLGCTLLFGSRNEMLLFHIFFQTPFFFFLSGQQLHHFSSQLPWNIDIRQWKPMDINPHSEKKRDLKVAAASKGRLIDRNGMTS